MIQLSLGQDLFKISTIHNQIKSGKNCSQIIDYFLKRCYTYNTNLNAIISFNPTARLDALKLDDYYAKNTKLIGKLHCIPTIIKDNIDISGMSTTGGIKALRYSIPNQDASIVKLLKAEGAILIAKSNLAELAHGNESSETGGRCHNPFEYIKSCGASSTGSGASIGAGLAVIAIGTDTDGSITIPGSFNGIYGLRTQSPSPSIEGILPLFERQDTVGPFAKYINDLVLTYSIMANNPTIYNEFSRTDNEKPSDLRVSLVNIFFDTFPPINYYVDNEVKQIMTETVTRMKSLQLNVTTLDFSQEELGTTSEVILTLSGVNSKNCLVGCTKQAYNKYFNNTDRFQSDAPCKKFDDLVKSPLLSDYWKEELNKSVVADADLECSQKCLIYDDYKRKYMKLIDTWFARYNADALAIPSSAILPYNSGTVNSNLTSFLIMATLANKLSFNVPVGYSKSTDTAPDGLPVGLLLIARTDRIIQTLKIAKLMENAKSFAKLPTKTPLLADEIVNLNSASLICGTNYLMLYSLVLLVLNFLS